MTETLFMIYSAAAAAVTLWLLGGMAVGRMELLMNFLVYSNIIISGFPIKIG